VNSSGSVATSHASIHRGAHISTGASANAGSSGASVGSGSTSHHSTHHSTHHTHSTNTTNTNTAESTTTDTPHSTHITSDTATPADTDTTTTNTYISPCGCWKGNSVETFQWLDMDQKARDMFIDIKYSHDFKVRGPTYLTDKKKVCNCCVVCLLFHAAFMCITWLYCDLECT